MNKQITVLSLFDGMSCGQIALTELGYKPKYYASEIDKHAIKVTMHNFPDTIQLGDVTKWKDWNIDWKSIDLILAGSPCQGFSFAGKQLAFDDPRSALFFTFVEILEHVKQENPKLIYLLENVRMKQSHENVISKTLKMQPIEINSALLSAQNRIRLYWTNIYSQPQGLFGTPVCMIPQPKDKGILLKDILETNTPEKYYLSNKMLSWIKKHSLKSKEFGNGFSFNPKDENEKSNSLNARYYKMGVDDIYIKENKTNTSKDDMVMQINPSTESNGCQPFQQNRVYDINGISPALQAQLPQGSHKILIPEATKKGYTEISPGECFDIQNINSKTRRGRKMDKKSNTLMAEQNHFLHLDTQLRIRRLTPTECKRLQTVPEHYDMSVVSDTQQYKMLGNGWTIDVIKHILKHID